jgi:hypothetical protein
VGGRQKNIYVAAFNSKFLELVERCADITGLKGRQQQSQHNASVINFGRDVTRALYTVQHQNQQDKRFLVCVVVTVFFVMVPAISHPEMEEYDPLAVLLASDNANSILDALALLDDCHPSGTKPSVCLLENGVTYGPILPPPKCAVVSQPPTSHPQEEQKKATHPYFYYRDFSTLPDPDPATPITAPGRIPNFPAKMYAILSRKDLSDIITWLPHGRSWKVLKPREFEVKVIPTYFEHSKFSSFIRQANGWGFRRIISKGADRNSYYHELFLRARPHLIKLMRRPPPSSKPLADVSTEPDFHAISRERPLPEVKEGDATTDAVARANFPRQATYSFVPPASYRPVTSETTVSTEPVAPKTVHTPSPQFSAPSQYMIPPGSHNVAGHVGYQGGNHLHAPPQTPPVQQQQLTHYPYTQQHESEHQPQPSKKTPVPPPMEDLASSGPPIHHVESTDSLLDLLSQPLTEPETYGSHTFYPLTT